MSTKWTFVRVVYYESPRSQARRAQTDRVTFIKGGALLSTNLCRGRNFLPCGE
ncbi:hypothetical protein SELSPUOL_02047 [Selenomonas sputigena ATCC 35185]|uniref:Uncharacterized protein n=1 Tax=Selenomonas sputigena (strain ATCC 35185 / DSM 20758 / CCUG 44933 / VPI D19B-28) TaxID=546271 RepID=C9LX45_SELS3|nr:hypothetical protein SELSPUOL_02047 [Selenomonas sputigena ATCC 35185]